MNFGRYALSYFDLSSVLHFLAVGDEQHFLSIRPGKIRLKSRILLSTNSSNQSEELFLK